MFPILFSIPTVAWFTSYDPDIWSRYYPTVSAILLEGSQEIGLKDCNKFTPTAEHLQAVRKIRDKLDIDAALEFLEGD